jgi:deoxyadenosine/deoxycytidine kinase
MAEKLRISTLEGNCFSGKSTLLRELMQKYNVKVVGEYADYANDGEDFPPFPSASYEDAKKSIDFFVEIEKRRISKAVDLSAQSSLPVVMDRSPLSCIVFQAAVEEQFAVPSAHAYSVDAFNKQVQLGTIVYPQALVYLEPENLETFNKRVLQRGRVGIDFLNTSENFFVMQRLYRDYATTHYGKENSIQLQSLEGKVDLVAFTAFEFISNVGYNLMPKYNQLDNYGSNDNNR